MSAPFFYLPEYKAEEKIISLNEDTSRHISQVLRMVAGEEILLTNGKGVKLTAKILEAHKKKSRVETVLTEQVSKPPQYTAIGISLLKNTSRFEWFLEKATELGISRIIPLLCERTEKQQAKMQRMQSILVSAMLQSQQAWLPEIDHPTIFSEWIKQETTAAKWIAHCMEGNKSGIGDISLNEQKNKVILIGPEGDFTQGELQLAIQNNYRPLSLGSNRLRTETAALVVAVYLRAGG